MAEFLCPQCRAEIHADLIETTSRAECPFCGADLSAIGLPQAVLREPPVSPDFGDAATASGAASSQEFPALPAKSGIQVVEAGPDRLVFYIPGGGAQAAGLGCFAIAWNGFMAIVTSICIFGDAQRGPNDIAPVLGLGAFLGLFWAVGLGMAFFWIRMKYERTFLLVERQRIVLQKVLFNRKRVKETALTVASRAELVESYQQDDVPVYRIEVQGQNRPAKFGTSLSNEEKDWLVDRINEFLAPIAAAKPRTASPGAGENESAAGKPSSTLAVLDPPGEINRPLDPGSLPANGPLRVDEDSPERLQFHYAAAQGRLAKWGIAGGMLLFCAVWYAINLGFLWKGAAFGFGVGMLFESLFTLPFLVAGLVPAGIGLMAAFGTITVCLTREALSCRWSVGSLGWTKRVPTAAISSVRIEVGTNGNPRVRSRVRARNGQVLDRACVVRAGERRLVLTLVNDEAVQTQVTSLVRTRLELLGYVLRNV